MDSDRLETRKDASTPWPAAGHEEEVESSWVVDTRRPRAAGDLAEGIPPADDALFVRFLEEYWPREPRPGDSAASGRQEGAGQSRRIGRFQIRRELGSGGFGTVYLAYDPKVGHDVAVKVPHPESRHSPDLRRRFEREARAAASLDHPNINPIYESGKSTAELYLVSHYCPGPTLAEWLKHRLAPVSTRSAAGLIATLAAAVEHAHERGVLHRDLKPGNVLLDRVDEKATAAATFEGFFPRLSDFGLARLVQEDADDARTRTGVLLGTPRYMSPEQAIGRVAGIGPRTDIYALGVMLYELLVGRPPFVGDTELETLRQIKSEQPISIRRLQPNVPRDLDTIAMKCLEKEPSRRYASAGELADDLRRFLAGEPILARPIAAARRMRLWTRCHPVQAVVLLTGVMVLIALPLGLTWHTVRLERAFAREESERVRAQDFEAQARASERAARANGRAIQHHVYSSEMRLAYELLNEGEFKAMSALVDRHDPALSDVEDLRGFEWWHLRQFRDVEQRTWQAHEGELNLLAFSADGQVVMTASYADRCAKTWQAASGTLLATFPIRRWNESRDKKAGAISPDGKWAATILDDNQIGVYDAATGREQTRVVGKGPLYCVTFSPNGRTLLAGGKGGTHLWEVGRWGKWQREIGGARLALFSPDSALLATMWEPSFSSELMVYESALEFQRKYSVANWYPILEAAYSADGRLLATVTDGPKGTQIAISNADSGGDAMNLKQKETKLHGVAFSADSKLIASATHDGSLCLWETEFGQPRGFFRGGAKRISQFAFSPDGRTLATSSDDGSVSLWDRTLLGAPQPVNVTGICSGPVVFGPDGMRVAVPNRDRSLMLIDVGSRRVERRLEGHRGDITGIAFSADGGRLATVDSRHLRVWSATDGQQLWQTESPAIHSVAWSPTSELLATGGTDRSIRLWDAATGKEMAVLEGHTGQATGNRVVVRFFPDGKRLASAGYDTTLRIWDVAARREAYPPLEHEVPVLSLAISPDGNELAVSLPLGKLALWKLSEGKPPERSDIRWFPSQVPWLAGQPSHVSYSADGRILGAAGPGGIFTAQRSSTRELIYALSGQGVEPDWASYSPDESLLAVVSKLGALQFWDTTTWKGRRLFGAPLAIVRSLTFSGDSRVVAVGSDHAPDVELSSRGEFPAAANLRMALVPDDDTPAGSRAGHRDYVPWQATTDSLRFWSVDSGVERQPLDPLLTLSNLPHVAWSAASGTLAAAGKDGSLWTWNVERRQVTGRWFLDKAMGQHVEAAARNVPSLVLQTALPRNAIPPVLAFSRDGKRLATMDRAGTVKLWNAGDWRELLTLRGTHSLPRLLAFSPDGETLVANDRGLARFYDTESGRPRHEIGDATDPAILCGEFSPDGRVLAMGRRDGSVQCADVASRATLATLVGHVDGVAALDFAPDGLSLATGGWDTTVRLWSVAPWREVAVLDAHRGKVHAVAFAPDGSVLATGGEINDGLEVGLGEVYLWRGKRAASVSRPARHP